MLPWSFSEEAAAEKHMAQVQHNMWVTNAKEAVLSVITGGGKWVEITIPADSLSQHLLLTAEKKFWRCVESGEPPRLFGVEPSRPRMEAVRVVDMSSSNSWAEFADVFLRTREAAVEHERAKSYRSVRCNRTHQPWPGRASDRFCVPSARSSARRRSSPLPHCPRHCPNGSSNRRRHDRPSSAGTAR